MVSRILSLIAIAYEQCLLRLSFRKQSYWEWLYGKLLNFKFLTASLLDAIWAIHDHAYCKKNLIMDALDKSLIVARVTASTRNNIYLERLW